MRKLAAQAAAMSAAPPTVRATPGRMPSSRGSMGGSMGSGQPLATGRGQLWPHRAMALPRTAARPWLRPLRQLQLRSGPLGVAQDMQVVSHLKPQTSEHVV